MRKSLFSQDGWLDADLSTSWRFMVPMHLAYLSTRTPEALPVLWRPARRLRTDKPMLYGLDFEARQGGAATVPMTTTPAPCGTSDNGGLPRWPWSARVARVSTPVAISVPVVVQPWGSN